MVMAVFRLLNIIVVVAALAKMVYDSSIITQTLV
jgi:hypothetical protein